MSDKNNMAKPDDDAMMTDAERALAARIAEDQRAVAPFLNVPDALAAAAVARVQRRIAADIATYSAAATSSPRPRTTMELSSRRPAMGAASPRRVIRIGAWSAAAAAAVAATLLIAVMWTTSLDPANNGGPPSVANNGGLNGGTSGDILNDDLLAFLLTDPPAADNDSDSLELLTVLAGELDSQSAALDAQLLAALLDS